MINRKWHRWIALAAATLLLAVAAYHHWADTVDDSRSAMLAMVPVDASAAFYINLKELRQAPFFSELYTWAEKPQVDAEYTQFLRATGFNYERDLDGIAIASVKRGTDSAIFAVADGHFDRKKISAYAVKFGSLEQRSGREVFSIPVNGTTRRISFTFLRKTRIALTDDGDIAAYLKSQEKGVNTAEWRTRFDRLAGSPVFAVIRQDPATATALAAQTPGSLRSPQLASLLNELQWITVAAKPENDRLRVVIDGEGMTESAVRQLSDFLGGIIILAQTGLRDARTVQRLDPVAREAYLEILNSAEVTKIDRGETKSVRLMFEVTPKLLKIMPTATPSIPDRKSLTDKTPLPN